MLLLRGVSDDALVTFIEIHKPSDISYSRNQLFTMFSMYLRIIIKVMIQKLFNRCEGYRIRPDRHPTNSDCDEYT